MSKKLIKNIILYGLIGIISLAIIVYFIFSEDGLIDFINNKYSFNMFWIILACVFQLSGIFMDVLLTYEFFSLRYKQVTFWEAVKVTMIGQFFCYITPASTGGQPIQAFYLSKLNVDIGYSSSALLQKLLVWQVSCMLYGSSIFIFNFNTIKSSLSNPFVWTFTVVGLLIQFFIVLIIVLCSLNDVFIKKLSDLIFSLLRKFKFIKNIDKKQKTCEEQINKFHITSRKMLSNPLLLIKAFVLTFIQLTFIYSIPYCLYRSFNLSGESIIDVISLQAFVNLVSSMVPLPGSTGAAEISYDSFFINLFGKYIKPSIILWRIITYYGMILVTVPFVYMFKRKHPIADKKEE